MPSARRCLIWTFVSVLTYAAAPAQAQTSNVTLRVATWGGQAGEVEANYVGSRFTRVTGIKIEWTQANPSDHVAKMLASRGREPPFDVVMLDQTAQDTAIRSGLVAKLDATQIPNLKHLYPQARREDGYGPIWLFFTIGLVYNKQRLKEAGIPEPTSWEDFWDPRLAGHISVPDISLPQGAAFVIKAAQLAGGDEKNVIPGLEKIAKLKPSSYYTASNTLQQMLASGDVWMSVLVSGRAWSLIDRGYPIGYVVPKEGSVAGIDTIDMVANTPRAKEAHMFINMQLDPLSQLGWAMELDQGPPSPVLASVFKAYPHLAEKMPSSTEDLAKLYVPDLGLYNANLKTAVDYWNRNVKR
jgi:putative spermidine/putrescine transport system substrate-binding protein